MIERGDDEQHDDSTTIIILMSVYVTIMTPLTHLAIIIALILIGIINKSTKQAVRNCKSHW